MRIRIPGATTQLATMIPFSVVGTLCIVAGGSIAAATAHVPTQPMTWMVAYLVLVGGVAQIAFGVGQAVIAPEMPSYRVVAVELVAFNIGNALVVLGTLLDTTVLVDFGGVALAGALILFLRGVRGGGSSLTLIAYRLLIAGILISIPVGLVLARL